MTTITAQNILDENNWTTDDISLVNCERLIDNAIDYINLETGLSMSNMSGAAGGKTATVTSNQAPVVKWLTVLQCKACIDEEPNVGVSSLSVTEVLRDPRYMVFKEFVDRGIDRLRGRTIKRT